MKRLLKSYQPRQTKQSLKEKPVCWLIAGNDIVFNLNYAILDVQVAFEALIFSQLHQDDVVPVICGK